MFELNKKYSTKELAQEMGVSYQTFRNNRQKYEKYLTYFYIYTIEQKGQGNRISYILTEQIDEYIPYKEYQSEKKNKTFREAIAKTIAQDNRQTGSNIGRIIELEPSIEVYDLTLNTIISYTRVRLKELVEDGYYTKTNEAWCYLDYDCNKYILLSEEQVLELKSFFQQTYSKEMDEADKIYGQYRTKEITHKQMVEALGNMQVNSYVKGCKIFADKYNISMPLVVPVYERNAFYNGKYKDLDQFYIYSKNKKIINKE